MVVGIEFAGAGIKSVILRLRSNRDVEDMTFMY